MEQGPFVIRVRFVGRVPEQVTALARTGAVYLGRRGQWCSLERALRYKSRNVAEAALHEKWSRLRAAGNRSVILSVVRDRAVTEA